MLFAGLKGGWGEGCLTQQEETPRRQEQLSALPQLPRPRPDISSPQQNKAPHCAGKNGKGSMTGQREPCRQGVFAGIGCPRPHRGVTHCLRRRPRPLTPFSGGSVPAPEPGHGAGCIPAMGGSSRPAVLDFPTCPFFFQFGFLGFFLVFFLVCVVRDGVGERRFPSAELARKALAGSAACWKGTPKIGCRGPCLAGLRGF